MTQEEIDNGNGLIRTFDNPLMKIKDGWVVVGDDDEKIYPIRSVKYHSDWNMLMPVVEKIESMGNTIVEIGKKHCRIQPILYNKERDCMQWEMMHENKKNSKIEAVWFSVVSFIKWHNSQKANTLLANGK